MTKDRLSELQAIRANDNLAGSSESLVPADEKCEVIEDFLQQIGSIKLEIQRIRNRIEILKKFHQQIEKCSHGNVRKELEEKVEGESQLITTSALEIKESIQRMSDIFSAKRVTPAMQRIKEVQLNSLLTILREAMEHYLECLVNHRDKSIQMLNNMLEVTNDENADVEKLLEEGKTALFVNNLLMDTLDVKYSLEEVEDRHKEIKNVEKSIQELRNTFVGLAVMVSQQGDKIMSLDHYVNASKKKVEKARKKTASVKRKKDTVRWRKLILMLVCILLVVILLVILFML